MDCGKDDRRILVPERCATESGRALGLGTVGLLLGLVRLWLRFVGLWSGLVGLWLGFVGVWLGLVGLWFRLVPRAAARFFSDSYLALAARFFSDSHPAWLPDSLLIHLALAACAPLLCELHWTLGSSGLHALDSRLH